MLTAAATPAWYTGAPGHSLTSFFSINKLNSAAGFGSDHLNLQHAKRDNKKQTTTHTLFKTKITQAKKIAR